MKYFSFDEFSHSDTAVRLGIDNSIPCDAQRAVAALVENVLDPLRNAWGRPLTVTSGYRCPALKDISPYAWNGSGHRYRKYCR